MSKNNKKKDEKLKVAVIREELVKVCDSDAIAALILNQAIVSHEATKTIDQGTEDLIQQLIKQNKFDLAKEAQNQLREGWFYKSPNSFFKEIMISSRATVYRRLELLVSKGYMIKGGSKFREMQNARGHVIEDTWWKVDIQKLRKDLAKHGYALNGYEVWTEVEEVVKEDIDPVHSEQGGVHGEQGGVHGEQGGVHSEQGGVHGGHQQRLLQRDLSKNSTKITNKESISLEEISELDVPVAIKEVLKEHKDKIDRLIREGKMKLLHVKLLFNANNLNINDFATKLDDVLESSNEIDKSFKAYFQMSIDKWIKDTNRVKAENKTKAVRVEELSEAVKKQQEQKEAPPVSQPNDDVEAEKARLKAELLGLDQELKQQRKEREEKDRLAREAVAQ